MNKQNWIWMIDRFSILHVWFPFENATALPKHGYCKEECESKGIDRFHMHYQ